MVTTPDMVCARDAQVVGHLLFARDLPARLIINRLRPSLVMRGAMPDVDEIIDTAGLQLMGVLPEDEQVAVANANGRPLPTPVTPPPAFPTSPAAIWARTCPWRGWKRCRGCSEKQTGRIPPLCHMKEGVTV